MLGLAESDANDDRSEQSATSPLWLQTSNNLIKHRNLVPGYGNE